MDGDGGQIDAVDDHGDSRGEAEREKEKIVTELTDKEFEEQIKETKGKMNLEQGGKNMNPRVEYEMTKEDLETLLDACKPVPVIMIGNYTPSSPQENANHAWRALGEKMGFDYMTVRPGRSQRHFTAVPSETRPQRAERLKREAKEKRDAEIIQLQTEIADKQRRLAEIEGGRTT